ncbi:J domain-containing protein [Reichenbachiella agariperforans]|uniref:J domain-containing protein n=1 Tax=Reichenbachiella agariperforans TaxID=156994 RepID=UPI001C083CB0|nr:J domain-containing protein [Reichenbachiella agariperforans]MBU2912876.1 J domain-containing protein [Reichenbachiella agariperforans]
MRIHLYCAMQNHYDILGVLISATKAEIRVAYKRKALVCHPDRYFGDPAKEEQFKQINEAHQVLTNDYARAKYDMELRYGQISVPSYSSPRPTSYHREGPVRRSTSITSKENIRATGYAFLFSMIIAVIIKLSIYFYQEQKSAELAEVLGQRREVFERARSARDSGQWVSSLEMLAGMGYFYVQENDIKAFKTDLLSDIKRQGDQYLAEEEYAEALVLYQSLKDYSVGNSMDYMKKLAFAHKGVGEIKEALDIYRTLHLYGYESLDFYYEMGELYETGVGDLTQALRYYQICADKAIASYEITIGKAYPIIIHAGLVPDRHYDVYMKVAELQYHTAQYDAVIRSVAWTKDIWPDSTQQYVWEAKSYDAIGDQGAVRRIVGLAKTKKSDFTLDQ